MAGVCTSSPKQEPSKFQRAGSLHFPHTCENLALMDPITPSHPEMFQEAITEPRQNRGTSCA